MANVHVPVVGEPVNLVHYCGMVTPYTVASVNEKGTRCVIRRAGLLFNGPQYYDSYPDYIYDDVNGSQKILYLSKKYGWNVSKEKYSYPSFSGKYRYEPYTD